MNVISFINTTIGIIHKYYLYILLLAFLLLIVVGCEHSLFILTELPIVCFIADYWYVFMLVGMLVYYYISYRKYRGFVDKRAIAVQYAPPKEKSLIRTFFVSDYDITYSILSAAILELVHLGYIELIQEAPMYIPVLHRKQKDISHLTDDQAYIMDELLFQDSDVYEMDIDSGEKKYQFRTSFRDIGKILKKWSFDEKIVIYDMNNIREKFSRKARLFLFIFIVPIFFILGANIVLGFFALAFIMAIIFAVFPLFKDSITEIIYYAILLFVVFIVSIKGIFNSMDISIFLDSSFYPMYTWLFLIFLEVYVMNSFRGIGQKGAYIEKHILGYNLFRKVIAENSQEEEDERKLYALHYNINTLSANALNYYFHSILFRKIIPKKKLIIRVDSSVPF